jgi:hypothetical protein
VIPSALTPAPQPRNDRLVALFLLGIVLFTPPLLRVFGIQTTVFGCPLMFVYIFVAWTILVALIALDVERRDQAKTPAPASSGSTPP